MTRQGKAWTGPTTTRVMKEGARQKKGGEPQCEPPDGLAETITAAQPFLNPRKKCHGLQRGGLTSRGSVKSGVYKRLWPTRREEGKRAKRRRGPGARAAGLSLGESSRGQPIRLHKSLPNVVVSACDKPRQAGAKRATARPAKGPKPRP